MLSLLFTVYKFIFSRYTVGTRIIQKAYKLHTSIVQSPISIEAEAGCKQDVRRVYAGNKEGIRAQCRGIFSAMAWLISSRWSEELFPLLLCLHLLRRQETLSQ